MFSTTVRKLFLVIFMTAFVMACSDDDNPVTDLPDPELNIVETADEAGNFTILLSVATDLGLAETLANEELTVFAPTDEAFNALPDGVLDQLTDEQLATILTYHILEGQVLANQIQQPQQDAETLQGERLLLQRSGASVTINGSSDVISADITASNGVIHAIDEVLLPSEIRAALGLVNIIDIAENADGFEIVLDAIEQAGLTTTLQFLGPFTVFPPNDEAFQNFGLENVAALTQQQLQDVLTYHVIQGAAIRSTELAPEQAVPSLQGDELFITAENGTVTINNSSTVFLADVEATNGVIHAVDTVLLPDAFGTVAANVQKRFSFSALLDAVVAADLVEPLADPDATLTVFAPDNDAFAGVPEEFLNSLSTEELGEILAYHVFAQAAVFSTDLAAEQAVEALNGENLYITASAEGVFVNGSVQVTLPDIASSNGVIHTLDGVLLPNQFVNVVDIALKNFSLSRVVDLVVQSDLVDALSDANANLTVFAPTNEAFDAISDALSELTPEQVTNVLLYHVLGDRFLSTDLGASQEVTTLNEEDVLIEVVEGSVIINGSAAVTLADQNGTNGVIHVINEVLLPPSLTGGAE
ncbi:MAG: fasciclin domain-containing protein [Balneolaceae bacterium]